jgi:hypothetical protein
MINENRIGLAVQSVGRHRYVILIAVPPSARTPFTDAVASVALGVDRKRRGG